MPLDLTPQKPPYYQIESGGEGIKQYIAIATQTGTNPPTMVILKNTIGDIIWTRTAAGIYKAELTGAFPANKTILLVGQDNFEQNGINYFDQLTPPNELNLQSCINSFNTPGDDKLSNCTIQIIVYP